MKVEIRVSDKDDDGKPFVCGCTHEGTNFIEGKLFTSVDYSWKDEGCCSPCVGEEAVRNAIARAKERIIRKGDIPIVVDTREGRGQLGLSKFI
jgi:hypothetical protein